MVVPGQVEMSFRLEKLTRGAEPGEGFSPGMLASSDSSTLMSTPIFTGVAGELTAPGQRENPDPGGSTPQF